MEDDFVPKEFTYLTKPVGKQKGIFELVKGFLSFNNHQQDQRTLVGRIHTQLKQDAHLMLLQLQTLQITLRKELDNHHDEQLWLSFEAVINPLLKEYRLLEQQLIQPTDGDQEHHNKIKNVNNWIDRAKLWVTLCAKPADRASVVQAVVEHTLNILDRLIDRDVKTLADYKEHELSLLGLGEEAYAVVMHRLDQDMTPHIQGLLRLKQERPKDAELATLVEWKMHADEQRSHLFNSALQIIDSIINTAIPFAPIEEEHEHLKDLIHRITYLENEAQVLQVQLDNSDLEDALQSQMSTRPSLFSSRRCRPCITICA